MGELGKAQRHADVIIVCKHLTDSLRCEDALKPLGLGVTISRAGAWDELVAEGLDEAPVLLVCAPMGECLSFAASVRPTRDVRRPLLVLLPNDAATDAQIERAYALGVADVVADAVPPSVLRAKTRVLVGARVAKTDSGTFRVANKQSDPPPEPPLDAAADAPPSTPRAPTLAMLQRLWTLQLTLLSARTAEATEERDEALAACEHHIRRLIRLTKSLLREEGDGADDLE